MAPITLLFLRYRIVFWQKVSMNIRDHVDYGSELWRLSGYITVLFVMAAYPLSLQRYFGWFWAEHSALALSLLLLWISLGLWILIRHQLFEKQADEQLRGELDSISTGVKPSPRVLPQWLRTWGWANLVAFVLVLVVVLRLLLSLS